MILARSGPGGIGSPVACPACANYAGPMAEYATPRGGMARLPQRDASASAGQEPAALHPLEPPVQAVQGAVRRVPVGCSCGGTASRPGRRTPRSAGGASRASRRTPRCAPARRMTPRCAAPRSSCRCCSRTSGAPASSPGRCRRSSSPSSWTASTGSRARCSSTHDAIIEKFVGDEVVGLFLPFLAGPDHAARAVEAARALFAARATGRPRDRGCRWAPACIRARRSSGSSGSGRVATSPRSAIR